ncbi:hypothetical protein RFI_03962 [Reticulomyxa filosa]|uniref:Uncharacterized protein n=1 Tax=Reticulomyxa filosa TaxID=46433 RepID=X6P4Y4_RETFI|nr:hypothetical protein RFI_03962 [Reticulomyxa filosa]|eukprot:ETO33144.1 hypothetical protein RFI_03962 [Reticulomyxa filosa]
MIQFKAEMRRVTRSINYLKILGNKLTQKERYISFKHKLEILFARSNIYSPNDEKTHTREYAWNAKAESEDENTQMITSELLEEFENNKNKNTKNKKKNKNQTMFEHATLNIVSNGLPFVEKDRKKWIKTSQIWDIFSA